LRPSIGPTLSKLEELKTRRPDGGKTARLLRSIGRLAASNAAELVRLHEVLLFLRAYPHDRRVLAATERLLTAFPRRVARLAGKGVDLSAFDDPELSGIAGSKITTTYSYDVVRWLAGRFPRRVRLDWEGYTGSDRLRALFPRFLPLLEEEALEDANVPYLEWLRAAEPDSNRDLQWLLASLDRLREDRDERAERFEALQVPIVWDVGYGRVTRTGLRGRFSSAEVFLHPGPLVSRREVSLDRELDSPPLAVRKLTRAQGAAFLELARESTALRYREYYNFTYGNPASVRAAKVGRGVEIFLVGLEWGRRLPLRAGYAAFVLKNGVPIGYFEGLAFFDRIEVGFNMYYTFREGESAWIFSKFLHLLRQVLGVTSFSIDPYQIGFENEEGIESGAFWFYRKLGFRPTDPKVARLLAREERAIAGDPKHRSTPEVLRRLVKGNLLYETDPARSGEWDRFHVRRIGLAVQRRMRARSGGDPDRARRDAKARVTRALGARPKAGDPVAREAFADLALVLALVPDLGRWTGEEKRAAASVVRAKSGAEEIAYLRLSQAHERLRRAVIRLGSTQ
jgi:hypothetical protein